VVVPMWNNLAQNNGKSCKIQRNCCMSLTFFGLGQFCTAVSLTGSMHSLPSEMIKPKYSTDVWLKEHLAGQR